MPIRVPVLFLLTVMLCLGTAAADPDTYSLLTLGREAAKLGDLEKAERYHRSAVGVAEQSGNTVVLAEAVGDLGGVLLARGRLREAKELSLKSLNLLRDSKGARYMPVVLNNLGVIAMNTGNYVQSEAFFKEALRGVRDFPRPDPYEARVLNNLGALYCTIQDLDKAEKAFKKAISVIEKQLGPDRAELAPFLSNLGGIYALRKKWSSAEPLLQRALSLMQQSPQPDKLNLAGVLDNLGMLEHYRKNLAESEKLLREAYELRVALLGRENPLAVVTAVKLAGTLRDSGRFSDSERLYSEALAILEKTERLQTADAATAFEELARLLRKTNREQKAEPLEAKAKAIRFDLEHTVSAANLP